MKRNAFTILEMMVVLLIVAILLFITKYTAERENYT